MKEKRLKCKCSLCGDNVTICSKKVKLKAERYFYECLGCGALRETDCFYTMTATIDMNQKVGK